LHRAVGDQLVVMSCCDESFAAAPADPTSCGERKDGAWRRGSNSLLILSAWDRFPTEGGDKSVIQLTGSWGGHWEVDRATDSAQSGGPGRTVPLAALLQRIRDERKQGSDPGRDEGTRQGRVSHQPVWPHDPSGFGTLHRGSEDRELETTRFFHLRRDMAL